jgi:hypothetical protein
MGTYLVPIKLKMSSADVFFFLFGANKLVASNHQARRIRLVSGHYVHHVPVKNQSSSHTQRVRDPDFNHPSATGKERQ